MKTCTACGELKALEEFGSAPQGRYAKKSVCRPCAADYQRRRYAADPVGRAAYMRDWRRRNPEKAAVIHRRAALKQLYGITPEDYDAMLAEQGGGCAVCGSAKNLHVDHCHTTGRVRAVLCSHCNTALGLLDESPERIQALLAYLERHAIGVIVSADIKQEQEDDT